MPISHALWTVGDQPVEVARAGLATEQQLEDMISSAPRILSDEWMLIGRQEDNGHGGRIDLMALAPDGSIVLVELKRNRTSRDVVAQALDYASWVEELESDDIAAIYARFRPGRNLTDDFLARFGQPLDEVALNELHQIVLVASSLDPGTERIVDYLNRRGIAINVLFFEVFEHAERKLLSRAWLIDPVEVQVQAAGSGAGWEQEPWNGEFYVSFGDSPSRNWSEAVEYGFISGGGGTWYSNSLRMLDVGDRVWVKIPGSFVGVGRVIGERTAASDFTLNGRPALELLQADYHREHVVDPEKTEYFVPVRWLQTVTESQGVQEVGMFGNQNMVCKPRTPKWRRTVERLKARFPGYD